GGGGDAGPPQGVRSSDAERPRAGGAAPRGAPGESRRAGARGGGEPDAGGAEDARVSRPRRWREDVRDDDARGRRGETGSARMAGAIELERDRIAGAGEGAVEDAQRAAEGAAGGGARVARSECGGLPP